MVIVIDRLKKSFGGVRAVNGVSLEVKDGEIVGIIGPNGSGKTTLINLITGYYEPDEGLIEFSGKRIDGMRPYEIAALGVARTFQVPRVFKRLSVMDNLAAALAFNRRARGGAEERARDLLKAFDLWDKRHEPAGNLSGGQQRILEIVRALMTRPRLLLLDEPTAGLNPLFIAKLKDILLDMKSEGTSTLIVEHNMRVVVDFCERVVAMSEGQIIAEGVPREVLISPAVIDSYLGR